MSWLNYDTTRLVRRLPLTDEQARAHAAGLAAIEPCRNCRNQPTCTLNPETCELWTPHDRLHTPPEPARA